MRKVPPGIHTIPSRAATGSRLVLERLAIVSIGRPCQMRWGSLFERKHLRPIGLHVHHRPTAIGGRFEALVEATDARLPVVSPFPFCIGVVHIETEMRSGS